MQSPAETQHFEVQRAARGRSVPRLSPVVPGLWRPEPGGPGGRGGGAHLPRMSETHPGQPRRGLDPMIGIRDLAKVIGVPVATIYDWRSRGLGPVAHRFGKHVKFAAVDVEAWIASRREQPTAAPGQRRGEDAARPELRRMEPSARPPRGPDTEERALRQGKPGSASPRQAGGLR